MKECRTNHHASPLASIYLAIIALVVICVSLIAPSAVAAKKPADSPMVAKCKSDLATRLKMQVDNITLVDSQPVTWPDAALGLPEAGKAYIQVLTPGFRNVLEAKNTRYLYTTSTKSIKYGGPIPIWSYSLLYTKPIADEPNLNGDLMQCSLLGTNSTRIASGVSEFYPQAKGSLLFTRRTSRSGFDLLYANAGRAASPKTIYGAFAFGSAALNDAQDKWAAIIKPMLGAVWNVVVGPIAGERTSAQILPVPDGMERGEIAWSADKLLILSKSGKGWLCYQVTPSAAKPEWKAVGSNLFPSPEYMLNKSETLEISETKPDGKPAVEVARVWFTGDHHVLAEIPDMKLRGYDFLGGRYAVVWGEKKSAPVFYTVDIATSELIPGAAGIGADVKAFMYPPRKSPLPTRRSF